MSVRRPRTPCNPSAGVMESRFLPPSANGAGAIESRGLSEDYFRVVLRAVHPVKARRGHCARRDSIHRRGVLFLMPTGGKARSRDD
jgi:hypothetical protein